MIDPNQLIVLILSTKEPRYEKFKLAIRNTWMQDFQKLGIKCFFYEGDAKENHIEIDTINLTAPDGIYDVSEKLVAALKLVYDKYPETRLIYRTNLSSFIDVENFMRFISINDINDQTYSGRAGTEFMLKARYYRVKILYFLMRFIPLGRKIQFASGSGFFLGSIHCKYIISSKVNLNLVDDIMVADTIKVIPSHSKMPIRLNISEENRGQLSEEVFNRLVEDELLFHYRFKTNDREKDAALLEQFGDPAFRKAYCTIASNNSSNNIA